MARFLKFTASVSLLLFVAACGYPPYQYQPKTTGEIPATIQGSVIKKTTIWSNKPMVTAYIYPGQIGKTNVSMEQSFLSGVNLDQVITPIYLSPGNVTLRMFGHIDIAKIDVFMQLNVVAGQHYTIGCTCDSTEGFITINDMSGAVVSKQHYAMKMTRL